MKFTTISDALIVTLVDSGVSFDGTNVLNLLRLAEARVIEANREVFGGNVDGDGNITDRGRRNILHTARPVEQADQLLEVATLDFGPLFEA
jgi:hypothetical protein